MSEYPFDFTEYLNMSMQAKEMLRIEKRRTISYFIKALLYTVLFICFYIVLEDSNSINKGFLFAVCYWGYIHILFSAAVWLLRNIIFPYIDGISGSSGCLSGCLSCVLFFGGSSLLILVLVLIVGGVVLVVLDHLFNFASWVSSPCVQYKLSITGGLALGITPFIWYWGRMVYCAISASKMKEELDKLKKIYEESDFYNEYFSED